MPLRLYYCLRMNSSILDLQKSIGVRLLIFAKTAEDQWATGHGQNLLFVQVVLSFATDRLSVTRANKNASKNDFWT